jgi:hypothetical protein
MTRFLFGVALMVAIGCTEIQPVGPFAKKGGPPGSSDSKSDKDALSPDPVVIPAPKPTPPMCLVHPEDVTAENPEVIKQQLLAEYEADRKSMRTMPVTAEVSQYKDGVNIKQ